MDKKEVIKELQNMKAFNYTLAPTEVFDMAIEALQDRPQGEWKPKNNHTDYCSNCGFEEVHWRTVDYDYCPNCNAEMGCE